MFIKEIFLQIIGYLKINEQIRMKQLSKMHYQSIKEKLKDYGFMCMVYNIDKTFVQNYGDTKNYIYNQVKILQNKNPEKYLSKIVHCDSLNNVNKKINREFDKLYEKKYKKESNIIEYYDVTMTYPIFQFRCNTTIRFEIYYTNNPEVVQNNRIDSLKSTRA